jgi:hypothetical protein
MIQKLMYEKHQESGNEVDNGNCHGHLAICSSRAFGIAVADPGEN